jgi:predicted RNase H-like HicB family nuclease
MATVTTERPLRRRRAVDRLLDALLGAAGSALKRWQVKRGGDGISGHLKLTIHVEEDEIDGGFVAECLELPGCVSQGETEREALENIVDAISGVIEARMQRHLETASFSVSEAEIAPVETTRRRELEIPVA